MTERGERHRLAREAGLDEFKRQMERLPQSSGWFAASEAILTALDVYENGAPADGPERDEVLPSMPRDLYDLLTEDQRTELFERLKEMADARRRAWDGAPTGAADLSTFGAAGESRVPPADTEAHD